VVINIFKTYNPCPADEDTGGSVKKNQRIWQNRSTEHRDRDRLQTERIIYLGSGLWAVSPYSFLCEAYL